MARTTVNISPDVLRRVRERAARTNLPLGEVFTLLLEIGLKQEPRPKPTFQWKVYDLGESTIDLTDWGAVKAFLYEEDDGRLGVRG
jgi:hypothetical protein